MKRIIDAGLVTIAVLFVAMVTMIFASSHPSRSYSQTDIPGLAAEQSLATSRHAQTTSLLGLALDTPLRLAGVLLAILAGLELLRIAYRQESVDRQLPALIALISGVLLISQQWPVAVAGGAVGVAVALRCFARPADVPTTTA